MKKRNTKILLVDDEPDVLEIVGYNLAQEGYQIITAANGKEAVEKARKEIPSLIIMDVMMPEMDGYELLQHVRQLAPEEGGDAPVIALTGCSDADERRKALDAGFARFLTKPVDPDQLIDEICHVLERDIEMN